MKDSDESRVERYTHIWRRLHPGVKPESWGPARTATDWNRLFEVTGIQGHPVLTCLSQTKSLN